MTTASQTRRSVYADKLREFGGIAWGDEAAFQFRGQWSDLFRERIGPAFDGRIIFEIGCSDATYLARIAAAHPRTAFVGMDWKCKSLYEGARRVSSLGITNLVLLRGRGQDVGRVFGDREVDEIWLFHPDPCDRDVELPNRLFGEKFLIESHAVLRDGRSVLALKTDHAGYYQWALALFGLSEPELFATPRPSPTTAASASADRAPRGSVRRRDLMAGKQIPAPSQPVQSRFDVTMKSADFWQDASALTHTAGRCFSGEVTRYESRFVGKRRPICYLEIQKKQAPGSNPPGPGGFGGARR